MAYRSALTLRFRLCFWKVSEPGVWSMTRLRRALLTFPDYRYVSLAWDVWGSDGMYKGYL
jgi:hypothetical protein